jgi:hypothetical protein
VFKCSSLSIFSNLILASDFFLTKTFSEINSFFDLILSSFKESSISLHLFPKKFSDVV